MAPASLSLGDRPARSRSRVSRRSPSTRKPAASRSLTAEIGAAIFLSCGRHPNRLNLSGKRTGRSCRINHAAAGNRSRIGDRGFWKLPILPKTGRARSASPWIFPGDPPAHTGHRHRARARPRPLRRARAVYRAPAWNEGARRTGTSPKHLRSSKGPPRERMLRHLEATLTEFLHVCTLTQQYEERRPLRRAPSGRF